MISKINALDMNMRVSYNGAKNNAKAAENNQNSTKLLGASYAEALKAQNNISFKGTGEPKPVPTAYEKTFIKSNEIRIPRLLDIEEDIHINKEKMSKDNFKLNELGLHVVKTEKDGRDVYTITRDDDSVIFIGKFDRSQELPEITYKQGKFSPEITIKDPSLKINEKEEKKIKMFAGSKITGNSFELVMPGEYEPIPGGERKNVSFKGHIYTSVLNKEDRTKYAFEKWYNSDLPAHTIKGDYADEMEEYDPNVVLLMGGLGERFRNITRDKENKPSAKLPTDDNYRIMATTLDLAASAGLLGDKEKDNITYLSQAHELKKEKIEYGDLYQVDKYSTDGGAVAEGLHREIIRNDKDTVILNGDIFTNADISRVYHALKTLPDAGLVIPYYPVDPERAKSLGMLCIEEDENNNFQIKKFIEKPKYTDKSPLSTSFDTDEDYNKAKEQFDEVQKAILPGKKNVFLANPGFYFMSKEAAKVLMAMGIVDSSKTGLGKDVMPKIVELANAGKLIDNDGKKFKVYTVPLEAKGGNHAVWEDIGTAETYLKVIKDAAAETKKHGVNSIDNKYYGMPEFVLRDFVENVDSETGIVFGGKESEAKFNAFKEKYGIGKDDAYGNIFVSID